MKRLSILLILILTALCWTLVASARDIYIIHSANIRRNVVTVNVTTQSQCALLMGVYDKEGRFLSVQTQDIGASIKQDVRVWIPDGIPEGTTVKTFLMGAKGRPLGQSFAVVAGAPLPTNEPDNDLYAILL